MWGPRRREPDAEYPDAEKVRQPENEKRSAEALRKLREMGLPAADRELPP
jgi:hypothetical protein